MAYSSVRATLGGKDVRKTTRQTRGSGKARRTPTEIGQTTPYTRKGQSQKSRALSRARSSTGTSRVYTPSSDPTTSAHYISKKIKRTRNAQRRRSLEVVRRLMATSSGTRTLSDRDRRHWQRITDPERNRRLAERRVRRWWREAKSVSGLKGPAPKVEFGVPQKTAAQVVWDKKTGEPKVQFAFQASAVSGLMPRLNRRQPPRSFHKAVARHEFAHVGQRRATGPKPTEPERRLRRHTAKSEGRADRFSKMVTRRLGEEVDRGSIGEEYAKYRRWSRKHDNPRRVLYKQFKPRGSSAERPLATGRDRFAAPDGRGSKEFRSVVEGVAKATMKGSKRENPKIQGPKEKRIARKLKRAARKSSPVVESPLLGPRQKEFVAELAKRTGLSPRVLGGMVAHEQPKDSPAIPGSDNWLNIGYFDSGPGAPTQHPGFFQGPKAAARVTARFLKGKELGAAPSIQAILGTAGKSEAAQIRAIQGSGWASSGYPNLPNLVAQVQAQPGKPIPRGLKNRAERILGEKAMRKVIQKGRGAAAAPKKLPGGWAGSKTAAKQVIPKWALKQATSTKRTPEHNAKVGGAPQSDHLTTKTNAFAYDLPADDKLAKQIANKLGLPSHTGTQSIVKNGYRYQLIWRAPGHYDHVHLGVEWVGEGVPEGTVLGPSGGGGGGAPTGAPTGATTASGAPLTTGGESKGGGGGRRRRRQEELKAFIEELIAKEPTETAAARRRPRVRSTGKYEKRIREFR